MSLLTGSVEPGGAAMLVEEPGCRRKTKTKKQLRLQIDDGKGNYNYNNHGIISWHLGHMLPPH